MGKVSPMNFLFICFNNIFFVVLFPFQKQSDFIKFNIQKFTEDDYNKIISFFICCIWRFVINFVFLLNTYWESDQP